MKVNRPQSIGRGAHALHSRYRSIEECETSFTPFPGLWEEESKERGMKNV